MANLPNLADRIEDTEVAANKPMTESLWRKFGSNVNFLLDFLGVSDGSTSPSGSLNDLAAAVATIDAHTITKQGVFPAGVTSLVGNYTKQKYVNRVFWYRNENGAPGTPDWTLLKSLDGGPNVVFDANPTTPASTTVTTADVDSRPIDLTTDGPYTVNSVLNKDSYSKQGEDPSITFEFERFSTEAARRYFSGALGIIGYESPMRNGEWLRLGTLNWRDYNSAAIRIYSTINSTHIWQSYELDVKSAPLYY